MLFEKKKKPITNAAELKDFKLFKDKPVPKKKNSLDIDPEDIVDVDVVMKREDDPPVMTSTKNDTESQPLAQEDTATVGGGEEEAVAPTSPFAKKTGKPSIKLGAKPDKASVADKPKKPLFSFGKSDKKESEPKKEKPTPPIKASNAQSSVKPYNALSVLLLGLVVAAGVGGFVLSNKAAQAASQLNTVQISITTTTAEIDSVLPKIAANMDLNKSVDVVQLMTRAQLLSLPNSDLSFEAELKDSHFYLNYFIKDSADQYDFTKFNEAEFPAFGTGQFSTCKTNNELTKQGEKDVFAIHVKC